MVKSQADTTVDIGKYLGKDENTIEVKVATVLLKENTTDLRNKDHYGLSVDITVTPYSYKVVK